MNNIDYIIILILALFMITGYFRGLVCSVLKIIEYFLSIFLALKFSPVLSNFLIEKFSLDAKINQWLISKIPKIAEYVFFNSEQYANLPESSKQIFAQNPNMIAAQAANMNLDILNPIVVQIINIICIVILFIILKILFRIIANILNRFTKLPILNEVNKIGGVTFGFAEGVLIICLLILIVNILPFTAIKEGVANSIIGSKVNMFIPNLTSFVLNI
jgi:uncharacterized membrane protein required for colicin V production